MKWITRERPKIDRIACPWVIRLFIDGELAYLYVQADRVVSFAQEAGAIPYDIPDVELSHAGEGCSFDASLAKYALQDPAPDRVAVIVRGADTSQVDLAPGAPGSTQSRSGPRPSLLMTTRCFATGSFSMNALYAWRALRQGQTHNWPPAGYRLAS
jgi:hypothetical protein